MLGTLTKLDIVLDVSIAAGLYVNTTHLQLDYRTCEETFLPYYPRMDDARRVSNQHEPIVCVPLNHFYGSRRLVTKQNLALAKARFSRREQGTAGFARLDSQSTGLARVYEKL